MKQQHDTNLITPDVPNLFDRKNRSQGISRFFSSIPSWALFVLVVISCVLIVGVGALVGYLRYTSGIRLPESPLGTAVGAILGLLGFMLGFTFSLTWSRFSNRNSLVISQAKALGVCYLRTGLLPEKQKLEIRKLFRTYTNILLGLHKTDDLAKSLAQIDELQLAIWQQSTSLIHEEMDAELRSLFIASVNEIISLSVERKTLALVFKIPDSIWTTLLFLAGMGMLAFGYQTGINGIRRLFEIPILPIAFGLVIVLIADLNSTSIQRRFKVTQQPLTDISEMMKKEMP